MTGRPSAWTLRPGHPDLCPGSNQPCLYNACYRRTCCQTCGAWTGADAASTVPGGGRVGQHYPTSNRPAPDRQLDLFAEEPRRG